MESFAHIPGITHAKLWQANAGCLYLRVFSIADLSDLLGTHIRDSMLQGDWQVGLDTTQSILGLLLLVPATGLLSRQTCTPSHTLFNAPLHTPWPMAPCLTDDLALSLLYEDTWTLTMPRLTQSRQNVGSCVPLLTPTLLAGGSRTNYRCSAKERPMTPPLSDLSWCYHYLFYRLLLSHWLTTPSAPSTSWSLRGLYPTKSARGR
jgi:hypothetical protein